MGPITSEKKRKASGIEPATKKAKKSKSTSTIAETLPATKSKNLEVKSTSSPLAARKRAADFYSDSDNDAATRVVPSVVEPGKTKKKTRKAVNTATTNGTVDGEVEIITKKDDASRKKTKNVKVTDETVAPPLIATETVTEIAPIVKKSSKKQKITAVEGAAEIDNAKPSKVAKGSKAINGISALNSKQTAVDVEDNADAGADVENEDDEDEDQAAALLAGFDDDEPDDAEDAGLDQNTSMPAISKDTKKRLSKLKKKSEEDEPGTVYVGRIPHGFYEHQMRAYFSQFGDITNLRLSRNRKTGASKHFAFIEFGSTEVAKIVAETMDNYLMFNHILKCKFVPSDRVHPATWKGANRRYKATPWNKLERQKLAEPKTKEQWDKRNVREQAKRDAKVAKMKEMGYDFAPPTLKSIGDVESVPKALSVPTAEEIGEVKAIESAPTESAISSKKRASKKEKVKIQKGAEEQLAHDLAASISPDTEPVTSEIATSTSVPAPASDPVVAVGKKTKKRKSDVSEAEVQSAPADGKKAKKAKDGKKEKVKA